MHGKEGYFLFLSFLLLTLRKKLLIWLSPEFVGVKVGVEAGLKMGPDAPFRERLKEGLRAGANAGSSYTSAF